MLWFRLYFFLRRFQMHIRNFLPGLKTNINTIVLAAASAAQVLGFTFNPEAMLALIQQWWEVALATPARALRGN